MSLITWNDGKPHWKPVKGAEKLAKKLTRADIDLREDKHKAKAKKRDGHRCRLPFCPWCAAFPDLVLHGAHVIDAKGMGGDPTLAVSQQEHLMALDPLAHASQEKHEWEVEPLTEKLCNGLCEFYLVRDVYDPETGAYGSERVLWAREKAIGVPDSDKPYAAWDPLRRAKVQD